MISQNLKIKQQVNFQMPGKVLVVYILGALSNYVNIIYLFIIRLTPPGDNNSNVLRTIL